MMLELSNFLSLVAKSIDHQFCWILDTILYYIMDALLVVFGLADTIEDFLKKVLFHYMVFSVYFRHQVYNKMN